MNDDDFFDPFEVGGIERATSNRKGSGWVLPTLTRRAKGQLVFWLGVAPVTLFILAWMTLQPSETPQEQAQQIVTPAAPEAVEDRLERSISAVVNGEIEGQVVNPDDLVSASNEVLKWQESEGIQLLANEISVAARIERAKPKSLCFKLVVQQCYEKRKGIVEKAFDVAAGKGNQSEAIKAQAVLKAIDRLIEGDTAASKYDPDLYRLARVRRSEAVSQVRAASAGGKARQQILVKQQIIQGQLKVGKVSNDN